jgi:thiamine biosynthesis lipoprotein
MVQAGGDMYVAGARGDRPWRVGIRDPRGGPSSYFAAAEVTDATFSTSGDYERAFLEDGVRYHHILDPATGRPAPACRSVTVMARDATTAEGLSKGVFILGPEAGLALVEGVEGAGAVVVDAANRVHVSRRLEGRIKQLHPPTDAP